MGPEDWEAGFGRSIAVFLNGDDIQGRDGRGERIVDVNFLLLFNAHDDSVDFTLPSDEYSAAWEVVIDTAGTAADSAPRRAGDTLAVGAKSLVVLRAWVKPEVGAGSLRRRVAHRAGGQRFACRAHRPTRIHTVIHTGAGRHMMRLPRSTYRLQISESFDLFRAADVASYLHAARRRLALPVPAPRRRRRARITATTLWTTASSTRLRGGAAGLDAASAAARGLGLGILVDIVPNHMGVATPAANAWWWDLLTHGRESRYAEAFDIDWEFGGGRVRIPVLGR